MKCLLLIALITFSYLVPANSQWHVKSCGVTDLSDCSAEEFECLWNKASLTAKRGATTTIVGSSIIVLGVLQAVIIQNESALWNAVFMTMIGGAVDLVGAPIWITGASRKKKLMESPHYQNLSLGSLKVYPHIGLNQLSSKHYVGMIIALKF